LEMERIQAAISATLDAPPGTGVEAPLSELAEALGGADIFRSLSPASLEGVARLSSRVNIAPGSYLAQHGETGEALYALWRGEVEITAPFEMGDITVRICGPSQCVPLGEGRLVTSARAISEVEAVRIPRDELLKLCADDPVLGASLFRAVAELAMSRYRNTMTRLTDTIAQALAGTEAWAAV